MSANPPAGTGGAPALAETPFYGSPWPPLGLALLLLPASAIFVYTMALLLGGGGPTGLLERMLAVYLIPLALSPFAALNLLFVYRGLWLVRLHGWGRPAEAEILALEEETDAAGYPVNRTVLRARLAPRGRPPFELRARLKARRFEIEERLGTAGKGRLPVRYDPVWPRRVLVEPTVPGARY